MTVGYIGLYIDALNIYNNRVSVIQSNYGMVLSMISIESGKYKGAELFPQIQAMTIMHKPKIYNPIFVLDIFRDETKYYDTHNDTSELIVKTIQINKENMNSLNLRHITLSLCKDDVVDLLAEKYPSWNVRSVNPCGFSRNFNLPMEEDMRNEEYNFVRSDFTNSNFHSSNLMQSNLSYLFLNNADFRNSHIQGAKFVGSDLSYAKFNNSNITGIDMRGANLYKADFRNVKVCGQSFTGDYCGTLRDVINARNSDIEQIGYTLTGGYGLKFDNAKCIKYAIFDKGVLEYIIKTYKIDVNNCTQYGGGVTTYIIH